jgi:DNA-binding GntR family transcriptional regulator
MALRSSEIYGELRRRILGAELAPGSRLVVRRLAEEFGCSDIPVREALRSLEGDGLIEIAPYRGAQVRVYRPEEVREAYLIRASLEAAATEAAAGFVDDGTLAKLERLIEQMDAVLLGEDVQAFSTLNREFHELIFSASPYRRLQGLISNIWDGHVGMVTVMRLTPDRFHRSNKEHRAIVAALRGRDGNLAARLALEHKRGVGDDLVAALIKEGRQAPRGVARDAITDDLGQP